MTLRCIKESSGGIEASSDPTNNSCRYLVINVLFYFLRPVSASLTFTVSFTCHSLVTGHPCDCLSSTFLSR